MKRRAFLQTAAATGVGVALAAPGAKGVLALPSSPLNLLAQLDTTNDKILVVIQLFGGNDGLNTVVPALDDNYYRIRPTISIPKNQLWNGIGDIYLHPALAAGARQGMAQMLIDGTLAIVKGVGYDRPNLSHFRSTDIWLSGINNSDPNVRLDTGWLGRMLEKQYPNFPASLPKDPLAINFGGFSLALTSDKGRMGIEVNNPNLQAGGLTAGSDTLDPDAASTHYANEYAFVADIANRSNVYAQRVKDAFTSGRTKLKGNYGSDSAAQQLASVAALIAGGLDTKVYFVGLGGFDTHVSQQTGGPMSGTHPAILARLADAVAQFQYDLLQLDQQGIKVSKRVIGMTVSEFGRRPYENGSLGTDHGAASMQFLFGEEINSAVYGDTPILDDAHLDANRDLPWQVDYRQIYVSILTEWFGMTLPDAQAVLQDNTLQPIGIIKSQSDVARNNSPAALDLSVSPNPFERRFTIDLSLPRASHVQITLADVSGRVTAQVVDRSLTAGVYSMPLELDVPQGTYLLNLRADVLGNRISGAATVPQSLTRLVHCIR